MRVKMQSTGRSLVGYDHDTGQVVRRKIYADGDGNEYVRLGKYASTPDAHVSKQWFCEQIMKEGMIER